MSALNSDLGGKLNVLVDVPRAMSPLEIQVFLATGVFPDLSLPPLEDRGDDSLRELTGTEARQWLGTLTACGAPTSLTRGGDGAVESVQTGTNFEPLSSSESTQTTEPLVELPAETELV